ncbi:MAG TPA: NAD(P)H-hydrate dehydratase [Azospirillaceae bacterium]|nr:NAD(P)H-hydrate dehydratase [Azospirillaceae bacterium]
MAAAGLELLTTAEMYAADRAAMAGGVPGTTLMERAGRAVARAIVERWSPRPVAVLCGPGNNGGDGFVAARHLEEAGWPVRVALLGDPAGLTGDAAWAASNWDGPVLPADPSVLAGAGLVLDALFGAGLARPLAGGVAGLVRAVAESGLPVAAVDVPSGVSGDDGAVHGAAAPAALTITFFRPKPGHLLLPGRALCGELVVADIGIPDAVLHGIGPRAFANGPGLWTHPWPRLDGHKYARGHALVLGGGVMTGAARLAARAALRAGAGLVTVAAPASAVPIYAQSLAALIVQPADDASAFEALLDDPRRNAVLLGPGAGPDGILRDAVRAALDRGKACVLDADVFAAFAGDLAALKPGLGPHCLLTPHEGEFTRLFPGLGGSKLERARAAARLSGACVLLKGADTVVAHPDGRAAINRNAPPDLATAGSGDVLAGFAAGLMAQGLDGFEAGCGAAWLHGETGRAAGPGLVADDLPEALPAILRRLRG